MGIDIRDGAQLECINCGLCVDACNHVMERTGRPPALITWDSLARQAAKAQGRHEQLRLVRPRSIIYAVAMLVALTAMGIAFFTRSTVELSVERDRAPLFVRLADGSIRNGYTVRVVNKTAAPVDFDLRVDGLPGGKLAVADAVAGSGDQVTLPVGTDTVGVYRILLTAPEGLQTGTSKDVDFVLINPQTKKQTLYHSAFRGP